MVRGRVDNVMIERLWRTKIQNACIYKSLIIKHLRSTIKDWLVLQSRERPPQLLVDLHPMTCIIKGNKISRLI